MMGLSPPIDQKWDRSMLISSARGLLAALTLALASLVLAGSASANVYAELLTSNAFGNLRVQADVGFDPTNLDIMLNGSVTRGDGIGNGSVGNGRIATFTHYFNPAQVVGRLLSASVWITTIDNAFGDGREFVRITLDDTFFAAGRATFATLGGAVNARLLQDGQLDVAVIGYGTSNVVSSVFKAFYRPGGPGGGGGGSAVPEPGGLALFYTGLGVFGVYKRRRARS